MAEPVLRIERLSKRFGGLAAVSDVSLDLHAGGVHALIGPNGAGKTTLINLLSGDLAPSAGSVRYQGLDIAGLAPERIARLGIARLYQKTNIFAEFPAFENCRLAAQARLGKPPSVLRAAYTYRDINEAAARALSLVGLAARGKDAALTLSHGEQRQLEIAMTLATAPAVLLLDEPLAGMGSAESQRMVALIARLAADHAIILVEHDMDAVFSVASVLTVMVDGRVLASGAPEAIRRNKAVQDAYLGTAEGAA
ncbi:MAG TPA: ABC transporter ATP-binding protein [Stellaceae bacterium]|nr:ABC transporter ATP-binding protein [Stellaceae bacterium]